MKNSVLQLFTTRLAVVGFVLAGLFLLSPAVSNAQTGGVDDFFTAPDVQYVSNPEAVVRIEAQLVYIKSQLQIMNPYSVEYSNTLIKYGFYEEINNKLQEGKTTKESLEAGLKVLGTPSSFDFSKTFALQNRTEAINLLKA